VTRHGPQVVAGLAALAMALVGAGCGGSSHPAAAGATTTTSPSAGVAGGGAAALQQAFVSVVQKVRPSVVEISTTSDLGSGIVYDTKGDIVTNDHVVGNATSFTVDLVNGQKLRGTLVGAYPPDDLAVIKVSGAKSLRPAVFGNSKQLQIGDIVMAIGNPLGLASSVTEGIISYNGRTVAESNSVVLPSTIQTSAAINPGNSGGALVDLSGDVVGIPTLAAVDQQIGGSAAPGIGFAIPSDTVKLIASQLISTGKVTHSGRAALGILAGDAVNNAGEPVGAIIVRVQPHSGAAAAGLTAGDVITAINGQAVTDEASLAEVLAGLSPGYKAKVTVLQPSGSTRTVTVTLGQLPG
jgi:putative serine protease PepD